MAYPYRATQICRRACHCQAWLGWDRAIGIYQASKEDRRPAQGSGAYPTSRYGVVPGRHLSGWATMAVARNVGGGLPTWEEWLGAVVQSRQRNAGRDEWKHKQRRIVGRRHPEWRPIRRKLADAHRHGTEYDQCRRASAGRWLVFAGWLADPVGNVWEMDSHSLVDSRPPIREHP